PSMLGWARHANRRVWGKSLFLIALRRRRRVFGDAAVPERGDVPLVPFIPRGAEFGDDFRLCGCQVVLLADVAGEIVELPAAVLFGRKVAPVHQLPTAFADRLLRAEAPVKGFVRHRVFFAGEMRENVDAIEVGIRGCAGDGAGGG